MTKKNIIIAGIVLILLIAIGITIVIGGAETKAGLASVKEFQSQPLTLEKVGVERASLLRALPLDSSVETHALEASANHLSLRVELVDGLQNVATLNQLRNNLDDLHLST